MEGGMIISLGFAFSLGALFGFFTKEATRPDTVYNLKWEILEDYSCHDNIKRREV
jgi:hypothetical protein